MEVIMDRKDSIIASVISIALGFMLIEVAVTATVGLANQIPELFMTTPWWLIFAACWVMFGGAMGVVQIIGKRK